MERWRSRDTLKPSAMPRTFSGRSRLPDASSDVSASGPVPPLALDEVLFLVGVVQRRRVADERAERPEEGGPVPGRVVLAARVAVSLLLLQIQDLEGQRVPGPQRAAEFYY